MSYKKIRVEVHCPVDCVDRVRWAMLKAAHESMMRNYDKVGYPSVTKCMSCLYKDKDSDDYHCLCCSEIGNGIDSRFTDANVDGEQDG